MSKKILKKIKRIIAYIKIYKKLIKNRQYWKNYYKSHRENNTPSSFAIFCQNEYFKPNMNLLELGCGNGRDSIYFAKQNINVTALDLEKEEITYLQKKYGNGNPTFKASDFTTYRNVSQYDAIYSRFTLHAISELEEERTIISTYKNLKSNGIFCIEVRSIKDEMFSKSSLLSESEGETDHYRRFANFDNLQTELIEKGFKIIYAKESNGLAKYKDEDPVIIRIVAQKLI